MKVKAAIVSANVSGTVFWIARRQRDPHVSDERPSGKMQQRVQMRVRPVRLRVNNANRRERDLSVSPDPDAEPVAKGCELVGGVRCSLPFSAAKRRYGHERIQRQSDDAGEGVSRARNGATVTNAFSGSPMTPAKA